MFRNILQPVLLLCIAALIGGCAQKQQMTMQQMMLSPYDEQPMKLKIKGHGAKDALDTPAKINGLLDDLGDTTPGNIKGRINSLLNSPGKLVGLGGIQSRAALETARVTLNTPGNFGGPLTTFSVTGQIQQSVWGESGFYYKPGDPMHMWVQMITTATRIAGGQTIVKSWAEMFRIEVPAGEVEVDPKNLADLNNVFPNFGAVAFTIDSMMAEPFGFKLWAVGNDVRVTDYWIDPNYDPSSGNPPVYLPNKKYTKDDSPPKFSSIFDPDPEACIDMMFVLDPALDVADGGALDNGELVPGADLPYYCLGRCRNPPVVNTP